MKFQVSRSLLLNALNRVQPVITESKNHPHLACFLATISDGKMTIGVTDMQVTVTDSFAVETGESNWFCVEFSKFYPWIVNSYVIGRDVLNIEIDSSRVRCWYRGQQSKVSFPQLDPDQYPKVFEIPKTEEMATAQGSNLAAAIQRTISVIVLDNTKNNPMFESAIMLVGKKDISFIASDGYIMSYVKSLADTHTTGEHPIPLKAMSAVYGMLSSSGSVRILRGGNRVVFQYDNTTVTAVLNRSSFPVAKVKEMLSVDSPGKALVIKDGVTRVINSFIGFVNDIEKKIARSILVVFDPTEKTMTISPNNIEDSAETLPVQQIAGELCEFSINYVYWLSCLKAVNGIEAWIHYDPHNIGNWIHITDIAGNQRYVIAPFARNN